MSLGPSNARVSRIIALASRPSARHSLDFPQEGLAERNETRENYDYEFAEPRRKPLTFRFELFIRKYTIFKTSLVQIEIGPPRPLSLDRQRK